MGGGLAGEDACSQDCPEADPQAPRGEKGEPAPPVSDHQSCSVAHAHATNKWIRERQRGERKERIQ